MTQKRKNEGNLSISSSSTSASKTQKKKKKKSIANTKLEANLVNQIIISNRKDKFNHISKGKSIVEPSNQMDVDRKAKGQQKKKSVANTKKTNLFNQIIISNGEDATQKFNHISKGKSIVEPSNDNTVQMDVDRNSFMPSPSYLVKLDNTTIAKASTMAEILEKKKSVANTKRANLFNQIIISNGENATQNLNHIFKGESIVEPSNDNTDQMSVDWATAICFQEGILMEILSRLPVRSLLRFKCVSKFWKTLISDPYFKMKHLNRAKTDQDSQKLLITHWCREDDIVSLYYCSLSSVQLVENSQKLDIPSNFKPTRCAILCCYDGLAVIRITNILGGGFTLLLWNPSTRESMVLPALELTYDEESRFGLGYDSTSGDYKILHIYQNLGDSQLPNRILALKSGSWRRIDKHPHGVNNLVFAMQFLAFLHAAFHWIAISRNCFVVVSFCISNEVYREIPLPEEMLRLRVNDCISVSVLDGMLCVYLDSVTQRNDTFKLWVLKEYGVKGSWMPLLTIKDPSIYKIVPKYRFPDGEVLFCCMGSEWKGRAFRTTSGPFVSWPQGDIYQIGYAFTESLISPK